MSIESYSYWCQSCYSLWFFLAFLWTHSSLHHFCQINYMSSNIWILYAYVFFPYGPTWLLNWMPWALCVSIWGLKVVSAFWLYVCKKGVVHCVARISKWKDVKSTYYEHGDYILNIKCISYPKRLHNIFILCVCLALNNWVHFKNWSLHFDKRIYALHPIEFGPLKIILT